MKPVLSLVTGTLNRRGSFNRLVGSIAERTDVDWELVVSDASDQPYPDKYPSNVVIIPERPRLGCVKGYNKAFYATRGKWVINLNDDAEVMPGYATAAIDFMEAHPEIGCGCLYYAETKLPYQTNEWIGNIRYPNFGIFPKELGDSIGWMDEDIVMYGNDNSLAFKVLLAGKGIATIPGARVWHHRVLDSYKMDNQKHRVSDSQILQKKYQPFMRQMLETYRRTQHLIGPMTLND